MWHIKLNLSWNMIYIITRYINHVFWIYIPNDNGTTGALNIVFRMILVPCVSWWWIPRFEVLSCLLNWQMSDEHLLRNVPVRNSAINPVEIITLCAAYNIKHTSVEVCWYNSTDCMEWDEACITLIDVKFLEQPPSNIQCTNEWA